MERFCKDLREYATEIMTPPTDIQNKNYENEKVCYICNKKLILVKMVKIDLNYIIEPEIIGIIQENLEGNSCSIS